MSTTEKDDLNFAEEVQYAAEYIDRAVGLRPDDNLADLLRETVWESAYVDSPDGGGSTNVLGIGRFEDGRWVSVEGWADYTGWGCQCGADFYVSDSRDDVISNGVTVDMARTLGIAKPGAGVEAKP